jgi:hypothetical protein
MRLVPPLRHTFLVPPHAQIERRLETNLANEKKRLAAAKAAATDHRKRMSGALLSFEDRKNAFAQQRKLDAKVELIRDNLSLKEGRS